MHGIEKQWQSLQDAYDKTPETIPGEPGKEKYAELEKMVDRLLRKHLSNPELRRLAASTATIPDRGFTGRVVEFMARVFVDIGDHDHLVELLSRRCPGRVGPYDNIEFYLAFRGSKLTYPIFILGEAYSKCQVPATRHELAAAVRRSFAGYGIRGKDDTEYVKNAIQWYDTEKDRLVVNPNYWRNEMLVPLECYERNPNLYDRFPSPYKRELLFEPPSISQALPKSKPDFGQADAPVRNDGEKVTAPAGTVGDKGSAELEGTWEVIEATDNGKSIPQEKIKGFRFVFRNGMLEWIGPSGKKEDEFCVRLGRQQEPPAIDLVQATRFAPTKDLTTALVPDLQEETTSAVYELKGDALRMCLPRRGAWQRPTSFKAEKGSRETSFTLKRVK